MFSKLKQFKDLRSQAKKLQKRMEEETLLHTRDGVSLTINGANEILSLDIADDLFKDKAKLIASIKRAFKEAMHDMQKRMAKKMIGADIDFDALKKLGI